MLLESRKRREHLSEEDLLKNKAIMESLTKGNTIGLDPNGEVIDTSYYLDKFYNIYSWLPINQEQFNRVAA